MGVDILQPEDCFVEYVCNVCFKVDALWHLMGVDVGVGVGCCCVIVCWWRRAGVKVMVEVERIVAYPCLL